MGGHLEVQKWQNETTFIGQGGLGRLRGGLWNAGNVLHVKL